MSKQDRREFLRRASALSVLGPIGAPLALNLAAMSSAAAQTAGDYRALVCVFLSGGNDAYNMVLANDATSWANYTSVRNQAPDPIALRAAGTVPVPGAAVGSPDRLGGVLGLTPATAVAGRSFALHPCLPRLAALFNTQRRLSVLSNVGTLVMPTTKADYRNSTFPKPAKLFSHNDQVSTWQALKPEGASAGWGGLMADQMVNGNGGTATFTSISASGNAVWLAGRSVLQYQVSTSGAIRMGLDSSRKVYGSSGVADAMLAIVQRSRGSSMLQADYAGVSARSISAEATINAALPGARVAPFGSAGTGTDPVLQYTNVTGVQATNGLAQQLQIVARMISAGQQMGLRRQIFYVTLGGFDTHDLQNRNHADLMLRLDHGLAYFDSVMSALGLQQNVTTFTASDFGRTFTSNGDGTDHGWGAHHFVMGGAVKGGQIAGAFPVLAPNDGRNNFASPDQLDGNGAMLPSTSVEQYAATLGRWFGVSEASLLSILPNLGNWNASARDLGLMT